ncbi:Zinc finger protein sfp1 [Choanephora cucurbitarum]|uniref:Zinc finger protein sfp1 n=1 Tax=Choanephora cucurbitarum TaxID=101091 RepID=A0A1C7NDN4_9FUNG|nr:Zinc finger protein sfp1 [Choanephora cucurbitarum]
MSSQNIPISFQRKHSLSTNGSSALSYSPSSHTMPAIFQHRDSFVHQRELESQFCSDLVCCGTRVKDLHELLHHYEEHHHAPIEEEPEPIAKEEDEEDDIMMEDIDTPLPTQPHELAALTSSPLLRQKPLPAASTPADLSPTMSVHPSPSVSQPLPPLSVTTNNAISNLPQHTDEILQKVLANAQQTHPELSYFRAEALYQTCDDGTDKPYKCPIANCEKAYKNPNGLKYHQMHGHSDEDTLSEAERDAQKPYMCTIGYCNKRYKNLNGLKYHIEHSHLAKLKHLNPMDGPSFADNSTLWSPTQQ